MAPLIPIAGRLAGKLVINLALGVGISVLIANAQRKVEEAKTAWRKQMVKKIFKERGFVVIVNND